MNVAVVGSGGVTAGGASQGSLLAVAPRSTTARDMLPSRPLDSRVLTIAPLLGSEGTTTTSSSGSSSGTLSTLVLRSPLQLVIPLRDLSIVSPSGGPPMLGQGLFLSPVINITCPTSPQAAAAPGGILATYASGGTGAIAIKLLSSTLTPYTDVVGTTGESAAGADAAIAGATSASRDALTSTGGIGVGVRPTASYTYVLAVPCGVAFGERALVCGAGMGGRTVAYACPSVAAVPQCLWYDDRVGAGGAWSTAGTAVAAITPTAITCNTTHFGPHAVRFAALPAIQSDIFASPAPLVVITPISYSPASFVAMALVVGALAAGGGSRALGCKGSTLDCRRGGRGGRGCAKGCTG